MVQVHVAVDRPFFDSDPVRQALDHLEVAALATPDHAQQASSTSPRAATITSTDI